MLGITTLQMGVFGGIIVGLGVAALHNRVYKIQLPQVLSFFGGTRFVPIISTAVYLIVGIVMFYIWPVIQGWIAALGNLVVSSGDREESSIFTCFLMNNTLNIYASFRLPPRAEERRKMYSFFVSYHTSPSKAILFAGFADAD